VIRVVDVLRRSLLLRVVGSILKKLLYGMREAGGGIPAMVQTIGKRLAERVSRTARGWGCRSAVRWTEEQGFIRYLTVIYVNTPELFRGDVV